MLDLTWSSPTSGSLLLTTQAKKTPKEFLTSEISLEICATSWPPRLELVLLVRPLSLSINFLLTISEKPFWEREPRNKEEESTITMTSQPMVLEFLTLISTVSSQCPKTPKTNWNNRLPKLSRFQPNPKRIISSMSNFFRTKETMVYSTIRRSKMIKKLKSLKPSFKSFRPKVPWSQTLDKLLPKLKLMLNPKKSYLSLKLRWPP